MQRSGSLEKYSVNTKNRPLYGTADFWTSNVRMQYHTPIVTMKHDGSLYRMFSTNGHSDVEIERIDKEEFSLTLHEIGRLHDNTHT